MSLTQVLFSLLYSGRLHAIDRFRRLPDEVQQEQLRMLIGQGAETGYFRSFGLGAGASYETFARKLPIVVYDEIQTEVERVKNGEHNVLWPGKTHWFARSSGTTADRSKYIPVTRESLAQSHFRGGRDVLALFADQEPKSLAFSGKTLTLGGSHKLDNRRSGAQSGDLSAILIHNTPILASFFREPSTPVALIDDFETKLQLISKQTPRKHITTFAGVPSWNLVMLRRILEATGKENIHEVWPDMSLFIHGGVSFTPYREQYAKLFPAPHMRYMETYNASEGFFGIQDDLNSSDMLLMLDYGIFYEFLPLRDLDRPERAVPLSGVETGVNYAMIISTVGGLWRYMIGDTVEFTSLSPYKIRITGRTKSFINAFGEEVIIDNAERAIAAASAATGAKVSEYTAAPVYMDDSARGSHQWVVEFETPPSDSAVFAGVLDRTLQEVNSDYAAKRSTTLTAPDVVVARPGTFYRWMEQRNKLGGQNKVPRLNNNRTLIDELLKVNNEQ